MVELEIRLLGDCSGNYKRLPAVRHGAAMTTLQSVFH